MQSLKWLIQFMVIVEDDMLEGLEVKGCWEIVVKRLRVAEEFFISSYLSQKSPIWTLLFSLLSFNFSLPNLEFASVREMLQLSFLMTSVELYVYNVGCMEGDVFEIYF